MNHCPFTPVRELPAPLYGRPNRFDAMMAQIAKEGHDVVLVPGEEGRKPRHNVTALKNAIRRTHTPYRVVQRQNRIYVVRV